MLGHLMSSAIFATKKVNTMLQNGATFRPAQRGHNHYVMQAAAAEHAVVVVVVATVAKTNTVAVEGATAGVIIGARKVSRFLPVALITFASIQFLMDVVRPSRVSWCTLHWRPIFWMIYRGTSSRKLAGQRASSTQTIARKRYHG